MRKQGGRTVLQLSYLLVAFLFMCIPASWASALSDSSGPPSRSVRVDVRAALPPQQTFEVPLSKGKFLVATERMGDPRFAETVILLVEHGRKGAVGLIINRPTDTKLAEVLTDLSDDPVPNRPVYLGGPVDMTRLTILVQSDEELPEAVLVFGDVYATGSRKTLEQILGGRAGSGPFRIYAGYAGWAPQQLEREVAAGGWYVTEADVSSVFVKQSSQVWPDLMRQISVLWVLGHESRLLALTAGLSGQAGRGTPSPMTD